MLVGIVRAVGGRVRTFPQPLCAIREAPLCTQAVRVLARADMVISPSTTSAAARVDATAPWRS